MSELSELRIIHDNDEGLEGLRAQLALRMTALLPDDPEEGALVLSMIAELYQIISESRANQRAARFAVG